MNARPHHRQALAALGLGVAAGIAAVSWTATASATASAGGSAAVRASAAATAHAGFGVTTSPQPLSNADRNTGGANGQCPGGPYCSTRDGSASMNGNGNGKAVGKPCAGCVGRADNKNPQGQMPNGSDLNAGYECDRNHGIGRTNPAHTRCRTAASTSISPTPMPTPTSPTPTPTRTRSGSPTPSVSASTTVSPATTVSSTTGVSPTTATSVLGTSLTATPMAAQHMAGSTSGGVPGETGGSGGASVAGAATSVGGTSQQLPFTGTPALPLLATGLSAIAVGTVLTVTARRRRGASGRHL